MLDMSPERCIFARMGLWQAVAARVRAAFTAGPYKPIDQYFAEMMAGGDQVTRDQALAVPALMRGRNQLASIATLPLELVETSSGAVVPSPFLQQIDPEVANVVTIAQTIEDLIFEGIAWWEVTGYWSDGFPATARRVDPSSVSLTPPIGRIAPLPSGRDPRGAAVYIDGRRVDAENVIRFDSPNPPVLKYGRAIKRANALDAAAAMYAQDPRPLDFLTPKQGAEPIDDAKGLSLVAQWRAARRKRATAWLPASVEYGAADAPSPAELQLVELQARASLDIANGIGVDPEDLGVSTTSRTYANVVDRRRDKINEKYAPYMLAITQRLGMNDVTKRGYTVRFALGEFLKSNPTEQVTVLRAAYDVGAIDETEFRNALGFSGSAPGRKPASATPASPTDAGNVTGGDVASNNASPEPAFTFGAPRSFELALEGATFTLDAAKRTIEGVALPYGKVATKYGMAFRFDRGSLEWADTSRVKLTRDHMDAVGVAQELTDKQGGLFARMKVAGGAAGDELIALATDGVYDGMSVGVDFDLENDTVPDPKNKGALLVKRATLREIAVTAFPAFDDARVTRVAASRNGRNPMDPCATCGQIHASDVACPTATPPTPPTPAPETPAAVDGLGGLNLTAAQISLILSRPNGVEALRALLPTPAGEPAREFVDPTRRAVPMAEVHEALPYRFDRRGNFAAYAPGDHVFSADLHAMARLRDDGENGGAGPITDAGKRVMGLINAAFVVGTDVASLNPAIQRPDMYVDQRDYKYPIYTAIDRGAPPNGIQPFTFPKFATSSGLVGDHTEGTEPGAGTFTVTPQTVTPTPVSGKATITREVWDMGGNPAVSGLIFNQMVRGYREGLESAAATFLNTLTAAVDINLGVAATDAAFVAAWESAVAALQFIRSYDLSEFVVDQTTYLKAAGAVDTTGKKIYPMINPTNANGQADARFARINMAGVIAQPSWALPSTPGSPNNSWLYDREVVFGWSTPPQRLEFPGSGAANIYKPVAGVDLAIWGYKAFANTDIGGVRQVIYDSV